MAWSISSNNKRRDRFGPFDPSFGLFICDIFLRKTCYKCGSRWLDDDAIGVSELVWWSHLVLHLQLHGQLLEVLHVGGVRDHAHGVRGHGAARHRLRARPPVDRQRWCLCNHRRIHVNNEPNQSTDFNRWHGLIVGKKKLLIDWRRIPFHSTYLRSIHLIDDWSVGLVTFYHAGDINSTHLSNTNFMKSNEIAILMDNTQGRFNKTTQHKKYRYTLVRIIRNLQTDSIFAVSKVLQEF